jgi:NAD(P)H dehydrogenase (quinone)
VAIIITGASGNFGRSTIEGLLDRMPASDLILVTRDPAKLQDFADQGAIIRRGDYDDYESLVAAFSGGETMLLISASKVGSRIPQHRNAINAAVAAGVAHVVYTSYVGKDGDNPSLAVGDHRGTEALLTASGLAWTVLRNSQYTDAVIEAMAPLALQRSRWVASAQDGKMAQVWRDDCVASAVAVLSTSGHRNRIYDITGPELLSFREIAAIISEVAGRPIEFVPVDDEEMYAFFDGLGIPREAVPDQSVGDVPWSSDDMVSVERAVREGYMAVISDHVEQLTGRKPRSVRELALQNIKSLQVA